MSKNTENKQAKSTKSRLDEIREKRKNVPSATTLPYNEYLNARLTGVLDDTEMAKGMPALSDRDIILRFDKASKSLFSRTNSQKNKIAQTNQELFQEMVDNFNDMKDAMNQLMEETIPYDEGFIADQNRMFKMISSVRTSAILKKKAAQIIAMPGTKKTKLKLWAAYHCQIIRLSRFEMLSLEEKGRLTDERFAELNGNIESTDEKFFGQHDERNDVYLDLDRESFDFDKSLEEIVENVWEEIPEEYKFTA